MSTLINNELTRQGKALQTKMQHGNAVINYTRLVMGDGVFPDGQELYDATAMIHEVVIIDNLTKTANLDGTYVSITGHLTPDMVSTAFAYRELGLFAIDPDTNTEILYSYGNVKGNTPCIIDPDDGRTSVERDITLVVSVQSADSIEVNVDSSQMASKIYVKYLEDRVEALENLEHIRIYGVEWPEGSAIPEGERLYNASGLVSMPGVNHSIPYTSFHSENPWPWAGRRKCNGYRDANGEFIVTAYRGDPGYEEDNPDKLVYVETPLFYYFDGIEFDGWNGYERKLISMYPVPGFKPSPACIRPDGTLRRCSYSAAYPISMVNDKPTSCSGVYPTTGSLNEMVENARKLGQQYTIQRMADWYVDKILMEVEFATKDMQSYIMGHVNMDMNVACEALEAENSVNRILLLKSQASEYAERQTVTIAATAIGIDDIAVNRKITTIEDKDNTQTYLYFDGTAVDIPIGAKVYPRPWENGAAAISAPSGSIVSNTDGKHPCSYRGKENPYGNMGQYLGDVLARCSGAADDYYYDFHYLPDATKYGNGSITSDYVNVAPRISYASSGFIKELRSGLQAYPWVQFPQVVGGSDTTYYSDYYWAPVDGICAVAVGGDYQSGRLAGPNCMFCMMNPGENMLNVGARLG